MPYCAHPVLITVEHGGVIDFIKCETCGALWPRGPKRPKRDREDRHVIEWPRAVPAVRNSPKRVCSKCREQIGLHHKWFFSTEGKPQHRSCTDPTGYAGMPPL